MSQYAFRRIDALGFLLVESTPAVGDEHMKRFGRGISPKNQATLNLYISGEFSIEIPSTGFSQRMQPGDTSLDLAIDEFPLDSICIERAEVQPAKRLCLSPEGLGVKWQRRVIELQPGEAAAVETGAIVIVARGDVAASGRSLGPGGVAVDCKSISSQAGARLAIARLI